MHEIYCMLQLIVKYYIKFVIMDIPNKCTKKKYPRICGKNISRFSAKYLYMSLLARTIQMFTKAFDVLDCVLCSLYKKTASYLM